MLTIRGIIRYTSGVHNSIKFGKVSELCSRVNILILIAACFVFLMMRYGWSRARVSSSSTFSIVNISWTRIFRWSWCGHFHGMCVTYIKGIDFASMALIFYFWCFHSISTVLWSILIVSEKLWCGEGVYWFTVASVWRNWEWSEFLPSLHITADVNCICIRFSGSGVCMSECRVRMLVCLLACIVAWEIPASYGFEILELRFAGLWSGYVLRCWD